MSWDLFVQDFPDVACAGDIPEDFRPASLGPRDAIITKITIAIPSADFSDPTWGFIAQDGWSIEINLGKELECESFALRVRGSGDRAINAVATILAATGLRGLDAQTGEFFSEEAALKSFGEWQGFRDQIGVTSSAPPPPAKRGFFARLFGG